MKFSSSSTIFATVAILASFANIANAGYVCPPPVEVTKTVPFVSHTKDLVFDFPNLPEADEGYSVTVIAEFSGDINGCPEFAKVKFGGRNLFSLGDKSTSLMVGSGNCYTDTATAVITATEYNSLRAAMIQVTIDATSHVGAFCNNDYGKITIKVQPKIPVYQKTEYLAFNTNFQTLRFKFAGLPRHADPSTPVTISGSFHGDLNSCSEYAKLTVGGMDLFTLGNKSPNLMSGAGNCYTDSATRNITAADYYIRNVKDVDVVLDTSNAVHNICPNDHGEITITVKPDCRKESATIPSSGGDPHITTWNNEHFEYHGQCDLTLVKDAGFADGLGLDVQIRTKVVRHWSYIKNVAIKIGHDILEIEGSADADDASAHYWINYEFQGNLVENFPFPITQELPSVYKRRYIIDLSSKYPGSSIIIQLYKEFVRVKFVGDETVFGNSVGLMGDYKTGQLLGRDGSTVMTDFTEFGDDWQVLPSEPKLFHEFTHPQFPELCIKPEDPRGERKRRLAESAISLEQAEAACALLKDPLSIKDCVYDILATQDLGMVGAF